MNILGLLLCVVILTALLLFHSYLRHGFRITFNFFLFALIVAISKEIGTFFGPLVKDPPNSTPFFFPGHGIPFVANFLTVVLGWVFTFYISWALAEKIIERLDHFRNKIFPTLLFSGIVVASISYAAEVVGTNMEWWKWSFHDNRFSRFLVEGAHFFALEVWFFFVLHFLIVFFLIECSRFSKSKWKSAFIIIFFIQPYLRIFSDWVNIEQTLLFLLLLTLSFTSNLSFEVPDFPTNSAVYESQIFDYLPVFAVSIVLFVSALLFLFHIKNADLLTALLPALILVCLSIKKINLVFIITFTLIFSGVARYKITPTIATVTIFLIFAITNKYKKDCKV